MFCPNWCSFFLWIGCAGSMSSFLYLLWFQRQTHVKGANKSWIPKLELSYLCCFFFLQNGHLYGLLMDHWKELQYYFWKGHTKSKILHIWKAYFTLEIVNKDKCPKYNGSSNFKTVNQNTVSTLAFNFPLSTCCSLIVLCSV